MDVKKKIGFALTGSFCTLESVCKVLENLSDSGYDILPIMSEKVYTTDTRFGKSRDFIERVEKITGKSIIHKIQDAEPIGPKKLIDALVIAPCTGNTLGKLANGIYDGCVTLSAKATLRNSRPVIIAPSTNDGLSTSARSIATLLNYKNIYFIPFGQDNPYKKKDSLVAKWDYVIPGIESALRGEQLQPVLM